jgi:hypothetical protein
MKLALALALALCVNGQGAAAQPTPPPDAAAEVHRKAVMLVEAAGVRERMQTAVPALIQSSTATMQKQCPDCSPAFFTEWGKRMAARVRIDDFVDVAVRAYEKRFTAEELTELLAAVTSQKAGKPVPLSPQLQKKISDNMPAIMGEITGGSTEIGARLGGEIGAEIQKEHPEYFPAKPGPNKP